MWDVGDGVNEGPLGKGSLEWKRRLRLSNGEGETRRYPTHHFEERWLRRGPNSDLPSQLPREEMLLPLWIRLRELIKVLVWLSCDFQKVPRCYFVWSSQG
jgi:hypothetical protein